MTDIRERIEIGAIKIRKVDQSEVFAEQVEFHDVSTFFSESIGWAPLKLRESGVVYSCGIKISRKNGGFLAFLPSDMPYGVTEVSDVVQSFGISEYKFDQYFVD